MAQKKKATKKKHAGGRPTKYKKEFVEQAYKLCALGATDIEVADFFKVCEDTVNNWKHEHDEFFVSIKKGKDKFDSEKIEGALKHRALGYDHPEVKINVVDHAIVKTAVTKHYPPETTALIFWLKNRNPERWRDKQEIDHTTKGESMNRPQIVFEQPPEPPENDDDTGSK
jgi:hypothetical protein